MDYSEKPVKVLFIMSVGRSGSTVLDAALGTHENIQNVGKLINLPKLGWLENGFCACGYRANDGCAFWMKGWHEWVEYTGITDVNEYLVLQKTMNQSWRRFKVFAPPDCSSSGYIEYANVTLGLYKSIQDVSGKHVIVDSSKSPLQAFILSFIPGIDLRAIHLI